MRDAHEVEGPETDDRAEPGRQRASLDPVTRRSATRSSRPGGVQAVERACRLLMEIIRAAGPLSVGELSRRTGLHQSTTSRLLASLQRNGLVERDTARGPVRIASALVGEITSRSFRQALLDAARPILDSLGRTTGETVNLSVPVASQLVDNIAQVDASHFLTTTNWVGRLIPLHCSSAGKVFLAYGVAELPGGPLARFTPQTITDRRVLSSELKLVRRRGFATLIDELEPGLRAVAVPVVDGQGKVVAAASVSGPSARLPKRRLGECAELLSQASVALTARLTSAWPRRPDVDQSATRESCLGEPCC
jgi:IclR family transcriptional regulator, acetate operon repressor